MALQKTLQRFLSWQPRAIPGFAARLKSAQGQDSMEKAKVISYEELKTLLQQGKPHVFDVRSAEEVAGGRIPDSINIPVAEVEEAFKMDPETFQAKYGVEKPQPDQEDLVFHCQMGRRGARATELAASLGYTKARNFAGGYKEWSEKEGK
ncbi:thiosulfate:glutathione sulfurtransferase isoform X2 [Pogona vitticeps]